MKSNREIFVAARELVEKGWTQRAYARDVNGKVMSFQENGAICYCSSGAIMASLYETMNCSIDETYAKKTKELSDIFRNASDIQDAIPYWNDSVGTSRRKVLKAFDAAIKACS